MKVERHAGLHVDAKATAAPPVNWSATGTQRSFQTALSSQRQRIGLNGNNSTQPMEPRAPRSRANDALGRNDCQRPSTHPASGQASLSVDRRPVPAPLADDEPLSSLMDRSFAARWRRAASHSSPMCIEVVHATSGSQFLLSREDGVWLLSMRSRTSSQNDEAIVTALRELFARRGLGPLDVVRL